LKVFIDTGAFCALTIPKDLNNPKAKTIHATLQKKNAIIYTSDYVLDETYTLLKMRSSHATAVKFMDQIDKSHTKIERVAQELEAAAKAIFRRFEDKRLSFTDCTSFALINHLGLDAVFAFDEHFRYHPYSHHVHFLE